MPRLLFDAGGDHTNSVFVTGGGRSGTTWLSDVLNWRNGYRNMYEPFHRGQVPLCAAFQPHQYLLSDDDNPRFLEPARRVFTGRIRNGWVDKYNRRIFARKRLIKDVRIVLSLRWVFEHFPGMPIVLIMRHPCATALSREQLDWPASFSNFLDQPELIADHLQPFLDLLGDEPDAFIRDVIIWCVEYGLPLSRFRPGEICLVFYERLCTSPEEELRRLCSFVGAEYDQAMLRKLPVPSVQATRSRRRTPSAIVSGEDLISSWRSHVTPERYARARLILQRFGLDDIYGDSDLPNIDSATALMRRS